MIQLFMPSFNVIFITIAISFIIEKKIKYPLPFYSILIHCSIQLYSILKMYNFVCMVDFELKPKRVKLRVDATLRRASEIKC